MIVTKLETISPEMAAHWLSLSKNPRPLNQRHVQDFVRHIENRTFELTHQGIALDLKDRLVDGQHRLSAIVATGKPMQMFVTRGLGENALLVVDRGDRRNNGVVLRCSQQMAQVFTLAARICMGKSKTLESDLIKVKNAFEEDAALLLAGCGTAKRCLSAAGVRLGAVLNMPKEPDWVVAQYRHLVLGEFDHQTPSIQWLYRKLTHSDRKQEWADVLINSYKAFNRSNKDLNRMAVKDIQVYLSEIRHMIATRSGIRKAGE